MNYGPYISPHFRALTYRLIILALALFGQASLATDVSLVGMFPNRALVIIDGAPPHLMTPGTQINAVRLNSISPDAANFTIDGRSETIKLGQYRGSSASSGRSSVTLTQQDNGHFMTQGIVNGSGSVRFLVDTGATDVVLTSADADRLNINYRHSPVGVMGTANGTTTAYHLMLNSVKIGDIVINQVQADVVENLTGISLLGMSFLNRTEMTRSGDSMVLTKRY
jgi:aspartyl protease family protein